MYKRICTAALVFGAAAIAPPVEAQNLRCLPRETLVETLQANYGEALTGGGLVSPQRILEVWSSEDSGSFTVFFTRPSGISCVVATGENWNSIVIPAEDGITG